MNHVLIVDDDQTLCQLLTEYLSIEQFEVSSVHDGALALPHLQQHSYDAVVLDIMLPKSTTPRQAFSLRLEFASRRGVC